MIWQIDRRRTFYLQASDKRTKDGLKTLSFQRGAELFNEMLAILESCGFKPDLEQLYKSDILNVLHGEDGITAWAPRPSSEKEEKALAAARLKVIFPKGGKWSFIIAERMPAPIPAPVEPRRFFLHFENDEVKQAWLETLKVLTLQDGADLLDEMVSALDDGFESGVEELWKTDILGLLRGEKAIELKKNSKGATILAPIPIEITLSTQLPPKEWKFTLRELVEANNPSADGHETA